MRGVGGSFQEVSPTPLTLVFATERAATSIPLPQGERRNVAHSTIVLDMRHACCACARKKRRAGRGGSRLQSCAACAALSTRTTASRDLLQRRRRERCFTLGGGSAAGVRVCAVRANPRCVSPRLLPRGLQQLVRYVRTAHAWVCRTAAAPLRDRLRRTPELHAQSPRSSHRLNSGRLPSSGAMGGIVRLRRRCGIRFV